MRGEQITSILYRSPLHQQPLSVNDLGYHFSNRTPTAHHGNGPYIHANWSLIQPLTNCEMSPTTTPALSKRVALLLEEPTKVKLVRIPCSISLSFP